MQHPPLLTDSRALAHNRARMRGMENPALFLHQAAITEIQERLRLVNKRFTSPAIITGFPEIWADVVPGATVVDDTDTLALAEAGHDLVIHAMALHWANDPVGQMIQANRSLQPDGLFLGISLGGQTLHELRSTLAEAETHVTGGLSPRIAPMAELRDMGGLLQRAGFALPVADNFTLAVGYKTARHLMRDLRAMGEGNALAARSKRPLSRPILADLERRYHQHFSQGDRITATFEMIILTGWAPDASQPKPLRPGSATTRLADALGTCENKFQPDDI